MNKNTELSFQKGDILAIGLVICMAAGLFLSYFFGINSAERSLVQIYQDGQLIREVPLDASDEQVFTISGSYTNQVVIRDGMAGVTESDCPGEDCVYCGWISQPGRSIVCLPNRAEIRIVGVSDVDFVVR